MLKTLKSKNMPSQASSKPSSQSLFGKAVGKAVEASSDSRHRRWQATDRLRHGHAHKRSQTRLRRRRGGKQRKTIRANHRLVVHGDDRSNGLRRSGLAAADKPPRLRLSRASRETETATESTWKRRFIFRLIYEIDLAAPSLLTKAAKT